MDKNIIKKYNKNSLKKTKTLNFKNTKITKSKKNSLLLGDSNLHPIKKNFFSNKNLINQIKNSSTYSNNEIKKQKNTNSNSLTIQKEISQDSEEISETEDNEDIIKNTIYKNKELTNKSSNNDDNFVKQNNNITKKQNSLDPKNIFNNNKNYFSLKTNHFLEEKNDNSITNTRKRNKFNLLFQNKIQSKINEIKEQEEEFINNQEMNNIKPRFLSQIINKESNINPKNDKKIQNNFNPGIQKNVHNPQCKKKINNSFPILKNKKRIFSQKNLHNYKIINNDLLSNNENNSRNQINISTDKIIGIDKETGAGCNFVELFFNGNTMTPYNTNGLLTLACKKYLNKNLIYVDESTPYDDIYLMNNMYMNYTNRNYRKNNNVPKKNNSYDNYEIKKQKTYNKSQEKRINKKEKISSKIINPSEAYIIGKVKFHLLQKKK